MSRIRDAIAAAAIGSAVLVSCGYSGPSYEWILEVDATTALDSSDDIVDESVEVLRRRINRLESWAREFEWDLRAGRVERLSDGRILLELQGADAMSYDLEEILQVARLEFKMVADRASLETLRPGLDSTLQRIGAAGVLPTAQSPNGPAEFPVPVSEAPAVMLNTSNSSNAIGLPPGLSLAWSSNIEEVDGDPHRYLYVLESEPIIENRHLSDASVDMNDFGRWVISFELTEEGGRRMGEVSEQHVDEAMAILFDGGVQSAPVIRARIGRRGQIEMGNSLVDAHRLVGMLVAGSLPAPVRVIEGPTAN